MGYSAISSLPPKDQEQLLEDLNYLNLAEIKSFCKRHAIPYRIAVESPDGTRKSTGCDDRKGVILDRVRHFLQTGVIPEQTCFKATVVCSDPLPKNLTATDRMFYGQYDKSDRAMTSVLKSLTGGKFKNGAIARILARNFWANGEAPTFQEFASAWLRAVREHTAPNPEWAFLSDRSSQRDTSGWKRLRIEKAAGVLKILNRIAPK